LGFAKNPLKARASTYNAQGVYGTSYFMAKHNIPSAIRGTQDIFGEDQERFGHVVEAFDRVRRLYNFKRAELPVFEATGVFARSLGESTDVVSKEMYSFEDRSGDSLTLRPEFTAGIAPAKRALSPISPD
jgi:histidyl-tRNA synthetase